MIFTNIFFFMFIMNILKSHINISTVFFNFSDSVANFLENFDEIYLIYWIEFTHDFLKIIL